MASSMDVDANDSGEAASGSKEHTAAAAEGAYSGLLDALHKTPKQLPCRSPRGTPDRILPPIITGAGEVRGHASRPADLRLMLSETIAAPRERRDPP